MVCALDRTLYHENAMNASIKLFKNIEPKKSNQKKIRVMIQHIMTTNEVLRLLDPAFCHRNWNRRCSLLPVAGLRQPPGMRRESNVPAAYQPLLNKLWLGFGNLRTVQHLQEERKIWRLRSNIAGKAGVADNKQQSTTSLKHWRGVCRRCAPKDRA